MRPNTYDRVAQALPDYQNGVTRVAWNGCSRRNRREHEIRDNMSHADDETVAHLGDHADTRRAMPADVGQLPARRNRHCASVLSEMVRPRTLKRAMLF
jgi:hypothetical protein